MATKFRVEFVYDPRADETLVICWWGMRVLDKKTMTGHLTKYQKDKIRDEMIDKNTESKDEQCK